MLLKQDWSLFKFILEQNRITKLYHFTDRANLENIIKNGGLYSWSDCIEKGINIPKPGGGGPNSLSWDLDTRRGLQNYVRVSFTSQHPMMYAALNDGRISDYVILEINPEVIWWSGTLYSDMNATRHEANVGDAISDFKKIHFSSVKVPTHFVLFPEEQPYFQAEILVKNFIPLSHITNIQKFTSIKPAQSVAIEQPKQYTPSELLANLWNKGSFEKAIDFATSGYLPQTETEKFIEKFISNQIVAKNYQREININKRLFRYITRNGSSMVIRGDNGYYIVTVLHNNYIASHKYKESEFVHILNNNNFNTQLVNEINFICQDNYNERMSMGVAVLLLAYAEPMTDKFKHYLTLILKEYLFLPEDYEQAICFFTPNQVEDNLLNLSKEKKKFLFTMLSKLAMLSLTPSAAPKALDIISSKRFQVLAQISKLYKLSETVQ